MAAMADSSAIPGNNSKLTINNTNKPNFTEDDVGNDNIEYGLPLFEVYRLALSFYKEKEGKAVHFSYEDKLQLVAFTQQVLHGPLSEVIHKLPPLGALDVVGKDRRLAWHKLGNLSADQSRAGFVELLSRKCPLFSTYIEAHRREKKEQQRLAKEIEEMKLIEEEEKLKKEAEEKLFKEQLEKEESIKRQIQQALNEQTYDQFKKYAEQHYPGDPEKQGALVRQLQEQHYIQYMQQLQVAQRGEIVSMKQSNDKDKPVESTKLVRKDENEETSNSNNTEESLELLIPASMWTRSDLEDFKQAVSQAEGDGVVRVGHGETVTVRVPTHQEGSRLFWEFATDHYDIGFGVYFEYGTPSTDQVSVHVSESEDEDADDLEDDLYEDEAIHTGDLEAGSVTFNGVTKPLLTEIVPVYRRDCQNEVYAGSHQYPGQGVYLLKFDNSYSLWRSKTLYYRVYYTQ